jgi:hypothetical protein
VLAGNEQGVCQSTVCNWHPEVGATALGGTSWRVRWQRATASCNGSQEIAGRVLGLGRELSQGCVMMMATMGLRRGQQSVLIVVDWYDAHRGLAVWPVISEGCR